MFNWIFHTLNVRQMYNISLGLIWIILCDVKPVNIIFMFATSHSTQILYDIVAHFGG